MPQKHHQKRCVVNDQIARQIEALWKQAFPDASLIPKIGLPSNNKGVLTLTHTDGSGRVLKINGLPSNSPLSNNALYSAECSKGRILNLYEIMLPDIPGKHGEPSTGQYYVNLLHKYGLYSAGVHFHWFGSYVFKEKTGKRIDRLVVAVHHQSTNYDPIEFSKRTIKALKKTIKLIEKRTHGCHVEKKGVDRRPVHIMDQREEDYWN